jgi:dTDP-glucose pyrophosphorylase
MLNIVVPMAGLSSRYSKEGYTLPKALVDVMGKPMIKRVIKNLTPNREHRFIFIIRPEHVQQYQTDALLRESCRNCKIIISVMTEGQAYSALLAKEFINNSDPVMIANCNQYVRINIDDYLNKMKKETADGLIMTFKGYNPAWSYVKLSSAGDLVCEVAEKQVISEYATAGIYNFARGSDYVWAAEKMIRQDLRVNGEFYVAPAYNMIIKKGGKVIPYNIGTMGNGMYSFGTPEELKWVLKNHPNIFERK